MGLERTPYPRDVAEMALAHTVGSATERAYARSDLFERRKLMMEEWAKFVATTPSAKVLADKQRVVSINETAPRRISIDCNRRG